MKESLKFSALSHRGLVRENNEDHFGFFVDDSGWPAIFSLADGMGGHQNGELASQTAVQYSIQRLKEDLGTINQPERIEILLSDMMQKANIKVYLQSLEDPANSGMGTTLTTAVFFKDSVYLGHIGDSRCYILRSGLFEKLSKDHTLVQQMMDAGTITHEEGLVHPQRHVLTQALGAPEYLQPEVLHINLKRHDRFLLCSDGLHGCVDSFKISETLRTATDPEGCCQELIQLALDQGGPDNVTVLVVFC